MTPKHARRRRGRAVAGLALTTTLLAGCSFQSIGMASTTSTTHHSSKPAKSGTPSRRTTSAQTSTAGDAHPATTTDAGHTSSQSRAHYVRGSLAAGSVAHRLTIGRRHLVLDYWTTQNVGTWTSPLSVPIHVSAHLEDSGRAKTVFVTRFFATFATNSSPNVSTLREDDGRFVITPPYSYDSVLLVPGVSRATRTAHLRVEVDMVVETAPNSKMYSARDGAGHARLHLRDAGTPRCSHDRPAHDRGPHRPRPFVIRSPLMTDMLLPRTTARTRPSTEPTEFDATTVERVRTVTPSRRRGDSRRPHYVVSPRESPDLPEVRRAPAEDAMRHATIAAVIPCYNEQDTIAEVLTSLLAQTRLPDVIHVVVNNTDDDTIEIANGFRGEHLRTVKGVEFRTRVHIHDMGVNADKKVGALNYGFRLCPQLTTSSSASTVTRPWTGTRSSGWNWKWSTTARIGGLSAIYTHGLRARSMGPMTKLLDRRASGRSSPRFNMDNLMRGRNMAVLGGQCSLFSGGCARTRSCGSFHQTSPWVRDSEVEDSLLSLQIKRVGYSTKISSRARAFVGGMPSLRALHSQQVKWNYGGIDLMWPGQRGNTKGQPLHPNLRLRWFENVSMLVNVLTRVAFPAAARGVAEHPRLRVQPGLADPARRRGAAERAAGARDARQEDDRHRLRGAVRPGRAVHVGAAGTLHLGVDAVLRTRREGQLGRPGQGRARRRLGSPVAGAGRADGVRRAELRVDSAGDRHQVGRSCPSAGRSCTS